MPLPADGLDERSDPRVDASGISSPVPASSWDGIFSVWLAGVRCRTDCPSIAELAGSGFEIVSEETPWKSRWMRRSE